ncbi:MAG: hypothetical protein BAJALOKI1v1_2560005 [Promethearchaeota archaeon]|nr:MAG: hypothetical protein BAJALOKI1v1_2560005 [Candidatus Lokiarchaeota archaeon]
MNIINWIKKKLFDFMLKIGTIERCYKCSKIFWYNGLAYLDTLYNKKQNSYGGTACKSCSVKTEKIRGDNL